MNSNHNGRNNLPDFKINVKIKLAALWVTVMLLYIYGDIFTLFVPGRIENLMNGKITPGITTPLKLLMMSIIITIPAIMVFLSLILQPKINRWVNIVLGFIYTIIMILTILDSLEYWYVFYIFLGLIEIAITSLIVWHACKWS